MTQKKVEVIPATKRSVHNGGQLKVQSNIRVAAYCRVSTGDESQQTSYTTQKAFYTNLITNKPGWRFAGIYADEAKSGTSREHREDFNRMMADALDGKLDYIVTKSISRFARNTVDTLNCVRQLRQQNPPVGVYFEKENIDTLDATGELILTILSALAQDESRSISDNIRWSIQKNFQAGKPKIDLNRMLGYDKGENGEWVINPEQAKTVRYIFERYVCGQTAKAATGYGWFMGYIVICYLIFYAVKRLIKDRKMQMVVLFGAFGIWFVVESVFFANPDMPFLRARQMLSFPAGVLLAINKDKIERTLTKAKNILILTGGVQCAFSSWQ